MIEVKTVLSDNIVADEALDHYLKMVKKSCSYTKRNFDSFLTPHFTNK